MKLWLSHIGSVLFVLVEVPGKEEWIEDNLIILDRLFKEKKNKRINLKVLTRMYSLPIGVYRLDHFPEGYSLDLVYERPSIYYHEVKKIYNNVRIQWKKC